MARIRIKITGRSVDPVRIRELGDFTKRRVGLHRELTVAWRDAGEAFIRAALRNLLVETGMSAASFFPLARAIKRLKVAGTIRQTAASPTGSQHKDADSYLTHATLPSGARTPPGASFNLGEKFGEKAFRFLTGTPSRFEFKFSFQTVVFQHAFHEASQATLSAGQDAFETAVRRAFPILLRDAVVQWLQGKKVTSSLTGKVIKTESI